MTLQIGAITVVQAEADATGWRPDKLPEMDGRMTDGYVNVRSGPSGNMPIVAVLRPGMRIVALDEDEDGWVPVAALGWVSKELLQSE